MTSLDKPQVLIRCVSFLYFLPPRLLLRHVGLVADADEVVCELLDGVGGYTGLDGLGVVGDEDGHVGLDDHNAFLALLDSKIRQQRSPTSPNKFP